MMCPYLGLFCSGWSFEARVPPYLRENLGFTQGNLGFTIGRLGFTEENLGFTQGNLEFKGKPRIY